MKYKQGHLEYIHISNDAAEAKVMLQGAHLFHFQRKDKKPLLWLSESACFEEGKAIRGGIPVCWPWFGPNNSDPSLPNHGFARTTLWEHIKTEELSESETKVTLRLGHSNKSLQLWPHRFELTLEITIAKQLQVSLITKNLDTKAFTISDALHTYLAVDDIDTLYVDGLDQKSYYDKVGDTHHNIQQGVLRFSKETDRIYQGITSAVCVHTPRECISVKTEGSQTVVIWNPGDELAAHMPDLSDHRTMLCIESANALDDEVLIQAQHSHTLTTIITQE